MTERAINIVRHLTNITTPGAPTDFKQLSDSDFQLETDFTQYGRQTFLHFDTTVDTFIVEITHIFGYLDLSSGINTKNLLEMLMGNKPSFQHTGMYIAVEPQKELIFVSLNGSHQYLLKWSDEDIAEAIYWQLCSLLANFMFVPPEPIKMFGEEN
jgi:hypothetical protein